MGAGFSGFSGPAGEEYVRTFKAAVACALCSVALTVASTQAAQASLLQPEIVSANPADTTPHVVLDGVSQSVYAFAQVGRTVYAGGRFNQVQDPAKTTTYTRQNFVAFDSETGVVSPLELSFDGLVGAIEANADGTALYISGAFAKVNGITRRGIVKYDLVNNRIDPTFLPTAANRTVSDLELANGAVIAAGNFAKRLVALDPITGADTGAIDLTVAGSIDPTDETRIRHIAVSPNGTRLVATGNFATVNGQGRKRAFMVNLGATSTLSTWYAPRFDVACSSKTRQTSAQGVDFSPDGSYFVIVATGGPTGTNGVCDAAARFETSKVSSTVQPTWINWTGGDTLYSVAITGATVYVGGHQRWLDNPNGGDSAGPGAVSRPGIGSIDPVTGKANSWNPTKSRNHGTMVLYATARGLWVGSDGTRFGGEDHAGIGFAPLDLGPTPDTTRPNTSITAGPSGSVTSSSAMFSFTATEPATFHVPPRRRRVRPVYVTDELHEPDGRFAHLPGGRHRRLLQRRREPRRCGAGPWLAAVSDLVGNPGFEVDTSGWKGDLTTNTLSRVAGGRSGAWAAEVSNSLEGGNCGIDDKPGWVTVTPAGPYTVSIWARSDTPGRTLRLRVREYVSGIQKGSVSPTVTLTSSWQQVTAVYTPVSPGLSSLDVEAFTVGSPVGVCFRADDASITH